jgi:hypothetical protein
MLLIYVSVFRLATRAIVPHAYKLLAEISFTSKKIFSFKIKSI